MTLSKAEIMSKNAEEIFDKLANKNLRVVGIKQVLKSLDTGRVRCVILAENADEYYKACVMESVKNNNAEVVTVPTKELLAAYCRVDAPTAVAALRE